MHTKTIFVTISTITYVFHDWIIKTGFTEAANGWIFQGSYKHLGNFYAKSISKVYVSLHEHKSDKINIINACFDITIRSQVTPIGLLLFNNTLTMISVVKI